MPSQKNIINNTSVMKKSILALAISCAAIGTQAKSITITEGFESTPTNWNLSGNAVVTSAIRKTGNKSLKLTNGSDANIIVPSSLKATITMWVYVKNITEAYESFSVYFRGANQMPSIWSRSSGYFHYSDGTYDYMNTGNFNFGQWFKIKITQDPNANYKYMYYVNDALKFTSNKIDTTTPITVIGIGASNNNAGNVELYVDDISINIESFAISGSADNVKLKSVVCTNVTTGEVKTILKLGSATSWDCSAAGLKVSPGDVIKELITGTAQSGTGTTTGGASGQPGGTIGPMN